MTNKLGEKLKIIFKSVTKGGILIFFPNYIFMGKCFEKWKDIFSKPTYCQKK